jgi:hypothetical protein
MFFPSVSTKYTASFARTGDTLLKQPMGRITPSKYVAIFMPRLFLFYMNIW